MGLSNCYHLVSGSVFDAKTNQPLSKVGGKHILQNQNKNVIHFLRSSSQGQVRLGG